MNAPRKPCPICHRANVKDFAPFCSKRCADEDLGKWFSGGYAVPGAPVDLFKSDEDEDQ